MGIRAGKLPVGTVSDTSYLLFTEGDAPKREDYPTFKSGIIGSANLNTTAQKPKEGINELVQDILDGSGYGVISGLTVTAQSTPNMTVNVANANLRTVTGARQNVTGNAALAVSTADTTNPRIDIVYVDLSGIVQYLAGTPNASPTAPNTPTGGFKVAEINVSANATSITNANIVDKRKILISTDTLNALLSERVKKTTATITYYVNASAGLDTNDGLSSGTAFKTIQYAINKVPLFLNNTVVINLAVGTYNEDLIISNFKGNSISIIGGNTVNTTYNLKSINVSNCDYLILKGINFTTTTAIPVQISSIGYFDISYINSIATEASDNILISYGSTGMVSNSVMSNHTYTIRCGGMSNVISTNNTGSNNGYSLVAQSGSMIIKDGTQPSGTNAEVSQNGGTIYATLATTETATLTLLNGWVMNYLTPKVTRSGNIVTLNLRIKSGTVTAGTQLLAIPIGFQPSASIISNVINVSGTIVGTVTVDPTAVYIASAFTNNTDAVINVSYYI